MMMALCIAAAVGSLAAVAMLIAVLQDLGAVHRQHAELQQALSYLGSEIADIKKYIDDERERRAYEKRQDEWFEKDAEAFGEFGIPPGREKDFFERQARYLRRKP